MKRGSVSLIVEEPEAPSSMPKMNVTDSSTDLFSSIEKSTRKGGNNSNLTPVILAAGHRFTLSSMVDLCCDTYCALFQDIKQNVSDSVAAVVIKLCSKRKANQKTTDTRLKALLDMLRSSTCTDHSFTFFFAVINGVMPRRCETSRHVLGFLASYVVILGYSDCFANTSINTSTSITNDAHSQTQLSIKVNDNDLSASHLRSKFKKHFSPKVKSGASDMIISLKKCICILDYLKNTLKEPHWAMSTLFAACIEYGCRLPWSETAMEHIFELLFRAVQVFFTGLKTTNHKFSPEVDVSAIKLIFWLPGAAKSIWSSNAYDINVSNTAEEGAICTMEEAMRHAEGKYIPICAFAAVMMYAWEEEYLQIKSLLEKRCTLLGRRDGLTTYYDPTKKAAGIKLTVADRATMMKLIDYTEAIGARGIDWELYKTEKGRARLPFAIPDTLLKRSYLELNYFALSFIESRKRNQYQSHVGVIQDDFDTFPNVESLNSFPELSLYSNRCGANSMTGGTDSVAMTVSDIEALARARYLKSNSIGGSDEIANDGDSNAPDIDDFNRLIVHENSDLETELDENCGKALFPATPSTGLMEKARPSTTDGGIYGNNRAANSGQLAMSRATSAAMPFHFDTTASSGLFDTGNLDLTRTGTAAYSEIPNTDHMPTLHDYMFTDKYFNEKAQLRNGEKTMSCFGGNLTAQGVRCDHMSPGATMKTPAMPASTSKVAAISRLNPIPRAYESPVAARHDVTMADTLTMKPDVLVKTKLIKPLTGQAVPDVEKFGFLTKEAETAQRPSTYGSSLNLDSLLLGKGNIGSSSAVASEFLELISNPEKAPARAAEFPVADMIINAVNSASSTGMYLGKPNSPDPSGRPMRINSQKRLEAVIPHCTTPKEEVESVPDSNLDDCEYDLAGNRLPYGVTLQSWAMENYRSSKTAVPTRSPRRILNRLSSKDMKIGNELGNPHSQSMSNLPSVSPLLGLPVSPVKRPASTKTLGGFIPDTPQSSGLVANCQSSPIHFAPESEDDHNLSMLIFRTYDPVGAFDRSVLDLSHISNLREKEYPVLNEDYLKDSIHISKAGAITPSNSRPSTGHAAERKNEEMRRHLEIGEPALKAFLVRDAKIDEAILKKLIARYLCAPYLTHIKKIDLSGNCLNVKGVKALSDAFASDGCGELKMLSLGGNLIQNKGLKYLIECGLVPGGAASAIMKLDVRNCALNLNNIVTDKLVFASFKDLTNLRYLDLSWNQFSADTKQQKSYFKTIFAPLVKLEVLSLAYNRIGDEACSNIVDCILLKNHELKILDISHCFLTNNCHKSVWKLLSGTATVTQPTRRGKAVAEVVPTYNPNSSSKLKVVILQGTILKQETLASLKQFAVSCEKKLVLDGLHVGIEVPVRYEIVYENYLLPPKAQSETFGEYIEDEQLLPKFDLSSDVASNFTLNQ